MAYSQTTWVNNSTPAINATNLNKMESGIGDAHDCANILYTPFGDIIATDVQSAITELENEKISKATLDANSIIKADTDDTPAVLTVAEQTLVGRITAGSIDDLSVAQVQTLINVEDGADVTNTASVNTAGAVMEADYNAQTILVATTDDTPVALGVGASELVGRTAVGNIDSLTMAEARTILNVADGATLYPDTGEQAFLDADHSKLDGVDALADVTDATNVAAAGAVMDGDFTAADEVMVGTGSGTHSQVTLAASQFFAKKSTGAATNVSATEARTILNIENGATADQSTAEIRTAVEAATDSNVFTDADHTKLNGVDTEATKYPDTGEQVFTDADHSKLDGIAADAIANVSEDSTPQLGGDLDLNGHEILVDTTPGSDHTGSGIKGVFTNGSGVTVYHGDIGFMASDGQIELADADADTSMPALYMSLATITNGASGEWLITGVVRDDTWNWTRGPGTSGLIYVSTTAGDMTQTAPSATGDQVQIVGTAISADIMLFNPSPVLVEIA